MISARIRKNSFACSQYNGRCKTPAEGPVLVGTEQETKEDMVKQLIQDQLHTEGKRSGSFNRSPSHSGGNMKIGFMTMLLMLSLLTVAGNITARAQGQIDDTPIEADVPHAFMVKETTLPAGKYTVRRLNDEAPGILAIRSADGRTAVIFQAESVQADQAPMQAELVFDKFGDNYFLSKIWASDSNVGYQLSKTKAQESLEGRGMKAEQHSIIGKKAK
jgi:hypothetical protein